MIHPHKAALLLALLLLPGQLHAASTQFEIDLKELDRQKPAPAPKPEKKQVHEQAHKQAPKKKEPVAKKKEPEAAASHAGKKTKSAEGKAEFVRYTVRPGDHIFKILMVHFGLSNEAAERLVPEVAEVNGIKNIKALEVGRTLLIPAGALRGHASSPARKEQEKGRKGTGIARVATAPRAPEAAPVEAPRAPEPPAAAPRAPEPAAPAAVPKAAPTPAPAPKTAPGPAPVPAPAPEVAPAPVPAPHKVSKGAPAPEPAPAVKAAPVPAPAQAPAAVKAAPPVVPEPPGATTWICPVARHDAGGAVDSILNAISATWSRNKIIHSGQGAATPFSIRVDRYFEYKGGRYIVSIGESDPYNYTLIRILESAGYRALMLTGKEDFKAVSEKLFKLVGIDAGYGTHALQEGKQATGFLVQQDDAGGRRVLITDAAPTPGHKWVLPPGCGAK